MNFTTYYQLKKPLGMEKYSIEVHNANSDILDSELKRLDQKTEKLGELSALQNDLTDHKENDTVHITSAERESWNHTAEHVSDTARHITTEERAHWNTAASHAASDHARADATKTEASDINGSIKINGMETAVYTHPSGSNPHGTTKEDLGLGEVENKNSAAIRNELTRENVTEALGYTPYTPTEVDNKLSALETNIDWKESVDTYDKITETYPDPQDGWTVNVKDTDYTYRYSGSEWVVISANAIPKATLHLDGLLTKEDKAKYDTAVADLHDHYATKAELNSLSDLIGQANTLLGSL